MDKKYKVSVTFPDGKVSHFEGDNAFVVLSHGPAHAIPGDGVRSSREGLCAGLFSDFDLMGIFYALFSALTHARVKLVWDMMHSGAFRIVSTCCERRGEHDPI